MASIDNYHKPTPSDLPNENKHNNYNHNYPLGHADTTTLKPATPPITECHESKMGDPCQSTF